MKTRALGLGVLLTLWGCSMSAMDEKSSTAPTNQCSDNGDCGGGRCDNHVCVAAEGVISSLVFKVEGPGTDLTLSVEGRKWVNSDGKANFPSGEVFTGPVEDSADGRIRFDVPAVFSGKAVEGIELEFKAGKVISARAERGDEMLQSALATDAGSRSLGEFAFGLNYGITRATKNILFDEKIGGTIHMAVGAGYPETGSRNRSAIHWDMIKDMKEGRVYADGKLVYEGGRFVV